MTGIYLQELRFSGGCQAHFVTSASHLNYDDIKWP
jgi:hypothetical protein